MKNSKTNALLIWKQFEDVLVPRLRLTLPERAVYSHLLRHSRLEGKLRLRFSIPWLARGARLCNSTAREAVRRLMAKGALRLVERSKSGHVVEARLPGEIRGARAKRIGARERARPGRVTDVEQMDFLQSRALRQVIHDREGGVCFYCLRRLKARVRCLDHVVPRVQLGRNSYRNLVSSCAECNSQKAGEPAGNFLRRLYRECRLTAEELMGRLGALEELAAGKVRPAIQSQGNSGGKGS